MNLSSPIPVRLTPKDAAKIKALQKRTNVSTSSLIRLAVTAGIPAITAQFDPGETKPRRKGRAAAA